MPQLHSEDGYVISFSLQNSISPSPTQSDNPTITLGPTTPTLPPTPISSGDAPTPTLVPPPPFSCTTNFNFVTLPNATYPRSTDTRTYSSSNGCFSSTGLGLIGISTGGPVACPCTTSTTLHPGNTCVYTENKNGQTVCISGYGAFGFNGGCKYDPGHSQKVACPSTMAFDFLVKDTSGNPLAGIQIRITDNGIGSTKLTDTNGKITIQSWSGDRVVMTPPDYRYTPNYIVATVNDKYSCGTKGVSTSPCTFTISQTTVSPTDSPSESPSPSGATITGDINGDGKVDILDYNILISCYNVSVSSPTSACPNPKAVDLDGSGVVDGVDYNILLRAMSQGQ